VPQTLVLMRMGGTSNRSLANLVKKTKEDYDIIRKHNLGGALTLLIKNVSKLKQFWNWKWS
jgi:glycosyltransferase